MGHNNGDSLSDWLWSPTQVACVKVVLSFQQTLYFDLDPQSHLASTALSTVSGVKIFSLTVSWRDKCISYLTPTTTLCSFKSFLRGTHCRFKCDRLLKSFGWNLQQLSNHPDLLCTHNRCHFLTLSLYPHPQRQSPSLLHINIIMLILWLSHKLDKLFVSGNRWFLMTTKTWCGWK